MSGSVVLLHKTHVEAGAWMAGEADEKAELDSQPGVCGVGRAYIEQVSYFAAW